MKYVLYAIIGWLALSACQPKPADKEKLLEEIDSTMQVQVQTLLKDKMEETRAYAGQVLVIDAATGKMRVCAGFKDEGQNLRGSSEVYGPLSAVLHAEHCLPGCHANG